METATSGHGPLHVLVANVTMRARTGTEVVVRQLALGLARRGHRVSVYAPVIGRTGLALRAHGIDVIDNLKRLRQPPDIIHGHHNLPTLRALDRFPDAAAIWMCHGWRAWWDAPPNLARIHRYVAIDVARRDYLVRDVGIAPSRVTILENAVDLARIPPRPDPLPAAPGRALAYTKTHEQLPLLRGICARMGLRLDALGRGVGREIDEPERELVHHDLVFATGRSAIDALCAGCAVVVADANRIAGLVTTRNYDWMRAHNFATHAFEKNLTAGTLAGEIARYDAADAARVCAHMRRDADAEPWLDAVIALYRNAVAEAARAGADDEAAVRRSMSRWYPRLRFRAFRHKHALRTALSRITRA